MSDILEVGRIVSGKILNVKPYGAFVSIDDTQKGLIHISHVSDDYIKDINQLLRPGDEVKVKVLSNDDGKIALSLKDVADGLPLRPSNDHIASSQKPIEVRHKCMANLQDKPVERKGKSFDDLMKDFNRQANDRMVDINRRLKNR